jgi:hypothetical protein
MDVQLGAERGVGYPMFPVLGPPLVEAHPPSKLLWQSGKSGFSTNVLEKVCLEKFFSNRFVEKLRSSATRGTFGAHGGRVKNEAD